MEQPVTLQNDSDLKNMNVSDWAIVANENNMETNRPMQHLSHRNSSTAARARATMAKHGARNPHTCERKFDMRYKRYERYDITAQTHKRTRIKNKRHTNTHHGRLLEVGQAVDLALRVRDALAVDARLAGHLELEQSRHLGLALVVQIRDVVANGDGEDAKDDGDHGEGRERHGDEELGALSGHDGWMWIYR